MKLISVAMAFFDRVTGLLAFLAGVLIIFMMLAVSTEVVGRYFLNQTITGVIDLSAIIILWILFLAIAWLLKRDKHVNMDILVKRLSQRSQAILNTVTFTLSALISLVLFWYGAVVCFKLFQRATLEIGVLEIPTAYVLIIIPIGSFLFFVQSVNKIFVSWKGSKGPEAAESAR